MRLPAECGTYTGGQRHYRRGEKPCEPCRLALRAHRNAQRLRNGAVAQTRVEYLAELDRNRVHGTRSEYGRGCRCEDCIYAARLHKRAWRAQRKDAL